MERKALALVCSVAAILAVISLPLSLPSSRTELLENPESWPQVTEMLKTYRVEVHPPPPICCPASPGVSSCCHGAGGGGSATGNGGDLTAQVNMVGFTDHGFGFLDYKNVRKGQEHFSSKQPKEEEAHKSSTLRAQQQHKMHRQRLAKVQKHLSREEKEVDALKGEVWALTSDVIPKMQREMDELRKRLRGGSRRARRE